MVRDLSSFALFFKKKKKKGSNLLRSAFGVFLNAQSAFVVGSLQFLERFESSVHLFVFVLLLASNSVEKSDETELLVAKV